METFNEARRQSENVHNCTFSAFRFIKYAKWPHYLKMHLQMKVENLYPEVSTLLHVLIV